jgi:hypothetical protein
VTAIGGMIAAASTAIEEMIPRMPPTTAKRKPHVIMTILFKLTQMSTLN